MALALFAVWGGGAAQALTLAFPGPATATAELGEALGSYPLPIGPWAEGSMLTRRTEGVLHRAAWRIETPGITTLEIMAPLRDQLADEGFRLIYECETDSCGGFDFRYSTPILPEPDMHVDLGDFRFIAAERGRGEEAEYLSLMVSRSSRAGFVQLVRVGRPGERGALVTASSKTPVAAADTLAPDVPAADPPASGLAAPDVAASDVAAVAATGDAAAPDRTGGADADAFALALESGTVALDDLTFDTGAAALGTGTFPTLGVLADYLHAHPDRAVALVGHTDAEGGLAGNMALSKRRAESVRERLIRDHDVRPAQVSAEGVGFLSPRDTNLTDEGRTRNRRVEVMLTSTR